VSALAHDLLLSLRSLARRPGYTAMAVAVLALGIGGASATFGLLRAVFLRPLPVSHPERLVAVFRTDRDDSGRFTGFELVSHPDFLDLASRTLSQVDLAVHQRQAMSLSGGSEAARVVGMFVSASYFDLLGLHPAVGRFFTSQEGLPGRPQPVVVLGHGTWHRWFAGDPAVLHRQVLLNGHQLEIIGVAPPGFQGTELVHGADLWLPLPLFRQLSPFGKRLDDRGYSLFYCLGRLRPGAHLGRLQATTDAISRHLEQEYPHTDSKQGFAVLPLAAAALGASNRYRYTGFGKTVAATFGLILLAACVTVANLLLLRGVEGKRDLAVRQALGAGRLALSRLRACEALLLFALGGLASLPLARVLELVLWRLRPPEMAQASLDLGSDTSVLAFALLLSAATAAVFGIAPAVRGTGPDLQPLLRGAAVSGAPGGRRGRFAPSSLMVMAQIGLALAVLIAAALFLRSLAAAAHVNLGFNPAGLAVATVAPGDQGYDSAHSRLFYEQLLARLSALPGASSASLAENRLLRGAVREFEVFRDGEDQPVVSPQDRFHRVSSVAPGFFRTAGIPLRSGRAFTAADCDRCERVAIVNRSLASALWPEGGPLGRSIHLGSHDSPAVKIVGVVENSRASDLYEEPSFFVYLPLSQDTPRAMTVHLRCDGDPLRQLPAIRRQIHALDPAMPVADLGPLSDFVARELWAERAAASLLGTAGLLALALAVLGVYAVTAQWVRQRRRELAIRNALGATRAQVLRLVARDTAALIVPGIVLGWTLALGVLRPLLVGQLHEVSSLDPVSYLAETALLAAAALAGSLLAFRRTARRDLALELRPE
jgi:predicted permease